ncbi:MAG: chemotaxis protein CheR [Magnetococcales bacterium]|nr:chemotaxis protein CheR [Magnetococcales bacterium]
MIPPLDPTTPRLQLTGAEFNRLADFIFSKIHIKMPKTGQVVMSARLQSRLRELGLSSFREYLDLVTGPGHGGGELERLIDTVTTNTTQFFRESHHFDFMTQTALPDLVKRLGAGVNRPLTAWSAACSSGQEPYSMAMVLQDFDRKLPGRAFRFHILATDISRQVLDQTRQATYPMAETAPIPQAMKKRFLLKSRDPSRALVRIVPELRSLVKPGLLNLAEAPFRFSRPMDLIFCRNVLIYFREEIKREIVRKFSQCLSPGGYLFIGNSESLDKMGLPFRQVSTTTYQRTDP